jgi:D-hexose-6-phosphate mutarotase
VMSFYEHLYSIRVRHGEVDRVVWNFSKMRNFEVKTFYKTFVCHEAASFPWNGI